jgi:copper homeostasis protein
VRKISVEICAEGIMSALAASRGGADRVELCENLAVGGVTPSLGVVVAASVNFSIPVHVLIRPRGGDFVYNTAEFGVMDADIGYAKAAGASGVVLGLLTRNGRINRGRTAELIEAARPMSVTFHKAFDSTRDPFEALDNLIELGVDRVLTSGHAPTAMEGLATLVELTHRASGRISVMAGGSIQIEQIRPIVGAGVKEIHLGSAACSSGVVDAGLVRQIVEEASTTEIYHITSRADWEQAIAERSYRPASLRTEGFIHASTAGQLIGTANRFYQGRGTLMVLRIDLDRVKAPIEWVDSPHSVEPFPHIHGPLNIDAVIEAIPFAPGPSGEFSDPAGGRFSDWHDDC